MSKHNLTTADVINLKKKKKRVKVRENVVAFHSIATLWSLSVLAANPKDMVAAPDQPW
jgi:hypothetical protein